MVVNRWGRLGDSPNTAARHVRSPTTRSRFSTAPTRRWTSTDSAGLAPGALHGGMQNDVRARLLANEVHVVTQASHTRLSHMDGSQADLLLFLGQDHFALIAKCEGRTHRNDPDFGTVPVTGPGPLHSKGCSVVKGPHERFRASPPPPSPISTRRCSVELDRDHL